MKMAKMKRLCCRKLQISPKLARSGRSYWLDHKYETNWDLLGFKTPRQRAAMVTFDHSFHFKILINFHVVGHLLRVYIMKQSHVPIRNAAWCNGRAIASHSFGPGFDSQSGRIVFFYLFLKRPKMSQNHQ